MRSATWMTPQWLAEQSPLAAPYFLGDGGGAQGGQGERLRAALDEAARALWAGPLPGEQEAILAAVEAERAQQGKGGRYAFLLLELHYFRRFFQLPRLSHIWEDVLYIGKSQYYRDLDAAVQRLGDTLLDHLRPAFRAEQPPAHPPLVGREALLEGCLPILLAGQAIALSGASGAGKTTLGAALAATWPTPARFWHTFRASFNDQLPGFLFALGAFLRRHGSAALWQQVIASKGRLDDANLALGLARYDLETIRSARPLLCLDEVDLLRPVERAEELPAHTQLLEFISGLRGCAPLLLIGQRAVLEVDAYQSLSGLPPEAVAELLHRAGIPFTEAELAHLHRYTGGNPRLLVLSLALRGEGEPLAGVLARLPRVPVLQSLWDQLWGRLSPAERGLLQALAVFRAPAPADAWRGAQPALDGLLARQLVQEDAQGGLTLIPAFRELIYGALPGEVRDRLHLHAAAARAQRGEWTAAAYHCWQGGEAERAVALWFPHAEQEMLRGQAPAARHLFAQLSPRRLSPAAQRRLALLRGRLHRQAGEPQLALRDLRAVEWPPDNEETLAALSLEAQLLQGQGQADEALDRYAAGLELTTRLLARRAQLHVGRGLIQVRQKAMQQAWQEATLAQYEAEHLQGVVQEAMGNLRTARSHLRVALALAEEAQHLPGSARTHFHLAGLAGRQGQVDEAAQHMEQALAYHERVGDRLQVESMRCHLAAIEFQRGDFALAADLAERALTFFERVRQPYWIAVAASNLAEARYETGDLPGAQDAAQRVLDQEEPQSHPYALFTLGNVHRAQQRPDHAETSFRHALDIAERNGDRYISAYLWRALGELCGAQGRRDEARAALDTALALFEGMGIEKEAAATRSALEPLKAKIKVA